MKREPDHNEALAALERLIARRCKRCRGRCGRGGWPGSVTLSRDKKDIHVVTRCDRPFWFSQAEIATEVGLLRAEGRG